MKVALIVAAVVAVTAFASEATASTKRHARVAQSAAQNDPYTACTQTGCGPVPFGCGKRPGIPGATGPARYDEIVCPPFSPGLRPR